MLTTAILIYAAAMTVANLSIAHFGPWISPLNAFVLIGLDLALRRWRFFQGKDCAQPTNARLCGGLATRREAEYRQCIGEAS